MIIEGLSSKYQASDSDGGEVLVTVIEFSRQAAPGFLSNLGVIHDFRDEQRNTQRKQSDQGG
jgi:hypothetical protein